MKTSPTPTHSSEQEQPIRRSIAPAQVGLVDRLKIGALRAVIAGGGFVAGKASHEVQEHSYGEHPDERLDLIKPPPKTSPRTAVVYFHGGGWVSGTKELYSKPLGALAEAGHTIFNIEYPLAPKHPHPYPLLSGLAALRWIRRNHPSIRSVHLVGDSAGANLAVMLGILIANPDLRESVLPAVSFETPRIQSIVSLYGVFDRATWVEDGFLMADVFTRAYVGSLAQEAAVQPANAVTPMDLAEIGEMPPIFIMEARKDGLTRSSRKFIDRLRGSEHAVEHRVYDNDGHGFYTFGKHGDDVADYLSRHEPSRS